MYQVYAVSAPQTLAAQPQYLLFNTETHRKSRKLYWSYNLLGIPKPGEEESSDESDVEVSESEKEKLKLFSEEPIPVPARVRVARDRAPSALALNNIVNNNVRYQGHAGRF